MKLFESVILDSNPEKLYVNSDSLPQIRKEECLPRFLFSAI